MYQIVDSLSWIKGTHTIKIGADLRDYRLTSTNSANSRGAFSFNGIYTGNAFADYLTGYPTSGSRSFPRNLFGLTENRYHFYVQDDWKVARNLTLNLGLRYELNLQPTAMLAVGEFQLRYGPLGGIHVQRPDQYGFPAGRAVCVAAVSEPDRQGDRSWPTRTTFGTTTSKTSRPG